MNSLEPCPLLRRMFTLRIATRGLDWEPSSLILNLNSTILISFRCCHINRITARSPVYRLILKNSVRALNYGSWPDAQTH
jgi:hypothetical protein